MKRRTNFEKQQKDDIVFTPTKEIQGLGFSNIFFAYDELNVEWSLHLLYHRVVVCNNNKLAAETTPIKVEQKQEEHH